MAYGNLHVFVGPMFAGKTEGLVKEVLYRTYFIPDRAQAARRVGIYKPKVDTRYAENRIVSHNGAQVDAQAISSTDEIPTSGLEAAFFDEVQFFSAPHFSGDLLDTVRALRMNGTEVYCSGLDMDYLGRAFEISSALMAEASHIERMTAQCSGCAAPATHTTRLEMTAERILLGARDSYTPMCARCWCEDRLAHQSPDAEGMQS